MFKGILKKVFGSPSDRFLKQFQGIIQEINALEPKMLALSNVELQAQTQKLKDRLAQGESLDALLPEAFATVREACKRTLGIRPFDVQLLGGIVMHKGMIVEMKTGEGKTLVATLPAYLNALTGKGVHVVTVNDYLARRDSEWMGQIYTFLGLAVGCITNELEDADRQIAYQADITYATNNELGFDYLRDNMKFHLGHMVQRPFHYAIVDEIDSILIDEARTPLIISGPAEDSSFLYVAVNDVVRKLIPEDYEKDEKHHNVTLTEAGVEKIESLLRGAELLKSNSLYDAQNIALVHHVNQALKAHTLYNKEKEYIVKDMKVVIIDEFTGRMMEGRRYSDGLHQALEAKEDVPIQMENQTLASITFQNYFRMYPKLAGMTGTCMTEAIEFLETYKLEMAELPTNKPCIRKDYDDEVYRTEREKFDAVITLIQECRNRQQPVLVGTASIEKSDALSVELKKNKIPHNVLNARYHDKEAAIIAEAGRLGAVTIATNMAGRGTDIKLGGSLDLRVHLETSYMPDGPEKQKAIQKIEEEIARDAAIALQAGGLYVIGTERHESRRIDNQLRGRSGRQGDPGASKFFLSLEDDLMRIFGSERLDGMLKKLGLKEGEAITHPWINRALEKAQAKVEARNYDARKHLLKYDNVMNEQRKVIYELRRDLMRGEDVTSLIQNIKTDVVQNLVARAIPEKAYPSEWDVKGLHEEVLRILGVDLPIEAWAKEEGIANQEMQIRLLEVVEKHWVEKYDGADPDIMRNIQKNVLLRLLDQNWKDHLLSLDQLRQGINLRSYAQRDPLNEYKQEAFQLFQFMLDRLKENVLSVLMKFHFDPQDIVEIMPTQPKNTKEGREDPVLARDEEAHPMVMRSRQASEEMISGDPATWGRVSRNAVCPCGSGKKFKQCHGKLS